MKLEEIPSDKITWKTIESYYNIKEIYNKNIIFLNVKNNSNFDVLYSITDISSDISSIELYDGIYTKINKNDNNNTIINYPLYKKQNNLKLKITFCSNIKITKIKITYNVADIDCNIKEFVDFDYLKRVVDIKTYEIRLKTNVYKVETGYVYKMTLININEFDYDNYYKICFGDDIKIYNNKKTFIFMSNSIYQDVKIEFYNKMNCFILEPIRPAYDTDYLKITSEKKGIYELELNSFV